MVGTEIGQSIDLTFEWTTSRAAGGEHRRRRRPTVNEGGDIDDRGRADSTSGTISAGGVNFTVTDADGALSGTLPDRQLHCFARR